MKIMIVGAGQVGKTVMNELFGDHSIVVVDRDSDTLDDISFDIDVHAGDGLKRSVLREAGLADTDVVIATTTDDQANLLVCNMATALRDCYTVARVSDPSYVQTWEQSPGAFGVDEIIGRANLTAEKITKIIGLQSSRESALEEATFCGGTVKMAEYRLTDESPIAGRSLAEIDGEHDVTFGAVIRNGDLSFARGDQVLQPRDKVAVFGREDLVDAFGARKINPGADTLHRTVDILGGGNIGFQTGNLLEPTDLSVRIFENDPDRADFLARSLPDTMVLQADVTQQRIWREENIPDTEMIVHSTGSDERNLLTAHLGLECCARRNLSIVHEQQYLGVFESLEIMQVVHPREVVASNITSAIEESYAETVAMLDHDRADVFETHVSSNSTLTGRPLEELVEDVDGPFVVGALVRDDRVIAPRGKTVLQPGDGVIIIAPGDLAEDLVARL